MKTIHAANMPLNLPLLRVATDGYNLKKCRLHPAQWAAFEGLALNVAELVKELLEAGYSLVDLALPKQRSIAGIPVELDLEFPMTKIQFLDEEGCAVTEIEQLPIPSGFWPE